MNPLTALLVGIGLGCIAGLIYVLAEHVHYVWKLKR